MTISSKNVKAKTPAKLQLTAATREIAIKALNGLWAERCAERGMPIPSDRAGACKFASLLARELFGGRLAGNQEHVFITLEDGQRLDLNENEPDVIAMGGAAHAMHCFVLSDIEYRQSLGSCMPRVTRWAKWALARANAA